jgi:hypothetical protein
MPSFISILSEYARLQSTVYATNFASDWAELLHKPLKCCRNKATAFSVEEPTFFLPDESHVILF